MLPPERRLAQETTAARVLRDALREMTDDDDAVRDTIEAESNLHETIHAALKSLMEDEIFEAGIDKAIKGLQERLGRTQLRIEKKRLAIQLAMEAGEIRKLPLPEATLSLRSVPPNLEVSDLRKIPKRYFVEQEPRLNKAALKQDLVDGKIIEGATLNNGGQSLSIRKG